MPVRKISLWLLLSVISISNFAHDKETQTSKLSNKLLKEGWHRKEIDQLMQFYIQQNSGIGSKKDQEFAPLPAPNLWKHIKFSKFKDYLKTNLKAYEDFKTKFPETDPTYPITYSSITEP